MIAHTGLYGDIVFLEFSKGIARHNGAERPQITERNSLFLPISKSGLRQSWLGSNRGASDADFLVHVIRAPLPERASGVFATPTTMSDDPAGACAIVCWTVCLEIVGGICFDFASTSKSSWALFAHASDPLLQPIRAPAVFARGHPTLA